MFVRKCSSDLLFQTGGGQAISISTSQTAGLNPSIANQHAQLVVLSYPRSVSYKRYI